MIELLLEAERALDAGLLDHAERIYWQAIERDPRNAIAVVGLAKVAIERGDEQTGYRFALKALEIDPEDGTARRLARRMAEVIEFRGEPLPEAAADIGPGTQDARVDEPPVEPGDGTGGADGEVAEATEGAAGRETPEAGAEAGSATEADAGREPEASRGPPEAGAENGPDAPRTPEGVAFGATVVATPLVVPARRRGLVSRLLRRR